MTIDQGSYEPAYVQLAGLIRATIESGELPPGAQLPSESSLVQQHGVSRETARRAVEMLRHEGRIYTRQGRGSFVRGLPDLDVVYVNLDVQVGARMPTVKERRDFDIPEGTPVLVVSGPDDEKVWPSDRVIVAFHASGPSAD